MNINENIVSLTEEELRDVIVESINILLEGLVWPRQNTMTVFGFYKGGIDVSRLKLTKHAKYDRRNRRRALTGRGMSVGEEYCSFVVDRNDSHGKTIHTITTKGVIVITSFTNRQLITFYPARPAQIKRYWEALGLPLPTDDAFEFILKFADSHVNRHLQYESKNNEKAEI